MKFCTITLGCKVNQYETGAIENILRERGFEQVFPGSGCDVCVINTCAVTAESVRKTRQTIRRMKKAEPDALIAVCGCCSQLDPDIIKDLGIDIIGGTTDRYGFAVQVAELVETAGGKIKPVEENKPDEEIKQKKLTGEKCIFEELPPGNTSSRKRAQSARTRALLKIQDGCDNFCTYCIVPYIRGRSRSLPLNRVAEYAKQLEDQGYKEIVITGIEISSYGRDLKTEDCILSSCNKSLFKENSNNKESITFNFQLSIFNSLITAVQTIHTAAPNARLRLGSLDPAVLTEDFCRELKTITNLCNHFHLSLQSGCDETLKRMGRRYTSDHVQKAIKSLRFHFKDCGITADLIVGFPGETEEEFEQTIQFIKKAAFSDMHIFPYSQRPGTKASLLPNQTDIKTKRERVHKATETALIMNAAFKHDQIGKTVDVLIEQSKNGVCSGHTGNYLYIKIKQPHFSAPVKQRQEKEEVKRNTVIKVKITCIENDILQGEII